MYKVVNMSCNRSMYNVLIKVSIATLGKSITAYLYDSNAMEDVDFHVYEDEGGRVAEYETLKEAINAIVEVYDSNIELRKRDIMLRDRLFEYHETMYHYACRLKEAIRQKEMTGLRSIHRR